MEEIKKLELKVADWYKAAPHLPVNVRKWIAENIWWITLVGLILSVLGIAGVILATLFASAVLVGFGGAAGAVVSGFALIAIVLSMAFWALCTVLAGMAINPLRALQKKGWTWLFVISLLQVVGHAAAFLTSFNVFGLVWDMIFVAVGAYFLFEIREYFGSSVPGRKTAASEKKA